MERESGKSGKQKSRKEFLGQENEDQIVQGATETATLGQLMWWEPIGCVHNHSYLESITFISVERQNSASVG